MDTQRNIEILSAPTVTVGGVTLSDGALSSGGAAAQPLSGLKKVRVILPEPGIAVFLGVVALLAAVGCGGAGSLLGTAGAACGASLGLIPLALSIYGVVRARKFDFTADDEGSWPLPADVDRAEIKLFGERLNRDIKHRDQPRQRADVLFTDPVPTAFPLAFSSIEPIPLEEARKTRVNDAEVETRIAVASAAWRVRFAPSEMEDVVKWGMRHRAIFALGELEGGPPQVVDTAPIDTFVARLENAPPAEAVERRRRTWARLAAEGHRMPPAHLPFLPAPGALPRTPADVAERARVTFTLCMAAQEFLHTSKIERLREPLAALEPALSPRERAFVAAPDRSTAEQLGWHLESVRTFAWALGWLPKGPDSTQQWAPRDAEAALLAEVRDGKVGETLLSADMLTDAFDYVYCARWIAVDATLKGQPVKGLHPAVLLLQHRALGWLIDGSAWDDVDVST